MEIKLFEWQLANTKGPYELPSDGDWYLAARMECIQSDLITKQHSNDVVKSYLKSFVRRFKNKEDAQTASIEK